MASWNLKPGSKPPPKDKVASVCDRRCFFLSNIHDFLWDWGTLL